MYSAGLGASELNFFPFEKSAMIRLWYLVRTDPSSHTANRMFDKCGRALTVISGAHLEEHADAAEHLQVYFE
jgi:hypothetical protein